MAGARDRAVWVADWTDSEHDAVVAAAPGVRVLRSSALGTTVGSRRHRARSYPAYASLALRGRRAAGPDGVLVAWQPLAGVLAVLLPGRRAATVLLNPLLSTAPVGPGARVRQAAVLAGVRRADRVVLFTEAARRDAVALGLDPARLCVVRLGAPPAVGRDAPHDAAGPVLALGRDHRDWDLLARAAARSGTDVLVAGPDAVPPPLRLARVAGRHELAGLLTAARAVVVPLRDDRRQAGTLAVLDALAAARPVVATAGPGTVDYLPADAGLLVPPGDEPALAAALAALHDRDRVRALARGADRAGRELSTAAFVRGVEDVVSAVLETRDRA